MKSTQLLFSFCFCSLLFLTINSAQAAGSWKLNCVSDQGISFYNENGLTEFRLAKSTKDGAVSKTFDSVYIENYTPGILTDKQKPQIALRWIGSPKVISETYSHSCNSDQGKTIFTQMAEVKREKQETLKVLVLCHEEIITSSSAIDELCN